MQNHVTRHLQNVPRGLKELKKSKWSITGCWPAHNHLLSAQSGITKQHLKTSGGWPWITAALSDYPQPLKLTQTALLTSPTSDAWKTRYQTNMFLQQLYHIYIHPRHIIPRWGPASGHLSWQRNSWHQCWRNELIDRELGSKQQIPRGHQIGWCFFFSHDDEVVNVFCHPAGMKLANNWGNNECPLGHRCFSLYRDWIDWLDWYISYAEYLLICGCVIGEVSQWMLQTAIPKL